MLRNSCTDPYLFLPERCGNIKHKIYLMLWPKHMDDTLPLSRLLVSVMSGYSWNYMLGRADRLNLTSSPVSGWSSLPGLTAVAGRGEKIICK